MKKILYITYYWPPSGGAGVQRSLKFVKYLYEFGIQAVVLTVDPKKASYPIRDETLLKEVDPQIEVHGTDSFEPLKVFSKISGKNKMPYGGFTNTEKESFVQRTYRFIRGNFFIPDARGGWVKHALKKAVEIIRAEKIDTIVISSPPHSSQFIGLKLKKRFPSLKWIADLRDPWTDIYYYKELRHTYPARLLDKHYEKEVLERCDVAVVVSSEIKRMFLKKSQQLDEAKIVVIPNGFDTTDFEAGVEPEKNYFVLSYIGTIADNYEPEILFSSFREVINKNPDVDIRLRFVGSASGKVRDLTRKYELENRVEMISHVSHQEAIHYMQKSSMLLLLIPAVVNDKGILTGKLFEYIGSGRPVVGIGPPDGDASRIMDESKSGKMFGRNQGDLLIDYLNSAVHAWQQDDRFNYKSPEQSKYSRRALAARLAEVIQLS